MKPREQNIIRIAITGPESTGKSTLSKALANHYNTCWIPEFARGYIDHLKRPYEYQDLLEIAKGQIAQEKNYLIYTNRYLFYDTDLLVLKIWSEHKFGKVHPYTLQEYHKKQYDLTLLMNVDLPWQYDPQREHPDKGQFFFNWYHRELKKINANFRIVEGNAEERFLNAVAFIDREFT